MFQINNINLPSRFVIYLLLFICFLFIIITYMLFIIIYLFITFKICIFFFDTRFGHYYIDDCLLYDMSDTTVHTTPEED